MGRVPGGGTAKRLVLETIGWILVVAGVAALVLPGPGLLTIFAGMVILSQQYEWAEKRLRPIEIRALHGAAESVQTWPRIVMSTFGALWLMATGAVWIFRPPAPDWWPFRDDWWLLGGWPAGLTLVGSGLFALGMIVYSFRRFRGVEDIDAEIEATARGSSSRPDAG